ncbi:MAG TPA: flagellar hook capping FlgD N-terminal domain-containing protein [Pirellulales bacterium]|jgi:flagellar basal-body rod modification protein FlgD|nr:flagellar hook capping FlgD N-terminal domain-containing protein [Pirellulales bacterium]
MSVGSVSNPTSSSSSSSANNSNAADPFANLNLNDFIQMMITELQNQDPTSPMSSGQMLQEITQMGQISTSEQLDTTLTGMETGQNLSNASSMIGMQVEGTDAAGNSVSGTVGSVTIANGSPTLNVGSSTLTLDQITNILPFNASSLLGDLGNSSDTSNATDATTPVSGG